MKTSLQLKLGQQLAMTPQLQQAIRLLQLSTLDLQQEIQEALDANPLLELEENLAENEDNKSSDSDYSDSHDEIKDSESFDTSEVIEQQEMPQDLPVDTTWDDVYSAGTGSTGIALDDDMPIYQGETTESLQDYLMWQVQLTPFSDTDLAIATAIIDAVDDQGYLSCSSQDILESLGDDEVELDEVEAVLKRIQQFDPLGVASRNLQECLLLQLATYAPETLWLNEAKMLLSQHIDLLGNRDFRQLMRETKLKEAELKEVMQLIHGLDPRPGNRVVATETEYVVPDVSVFKDNGKWVVTINPDSVPRIKVNEQYAALSKQTRNSADSQFIKTHLQDAKWLIKSLESRNETLLKVARCIVEHQQDFFEYGEEAMKPMVLNDIALAVDMHESTISRVTTQKYMHTPRGIFELKYFFSSHVSTDSGGECSSTAIRALVKKLVAAENQSKPLSDSKIATLLAEQGIMVARRTIAKYRESLGIPPSNQRKRLI
ncbi:RNA polymerase factor sigma-54 [Photobacterium damselae subsp. piscicida]|uniref:RNA polymerase sigma-54 factor n=2 Tax=Photobacterium damselae TaxID=38293 RepID=A0A1Q9H2H2_PHODP|nr:RNA polymerase factor sigma-54 [Photobacterium damselae]EJN6960723.1 RNA polymerase factor sigma-54 [Photobacterium damselae]KAB1518233.1 RNA polymerase factor sigma-54 [Photobacterium damselae subsp. damselae]MBE8128272.1 RNA polymerase factor sigma-54 [Photobacterium damselae subsp. piscicida]MCG9779297.1 RNA polymerase factor sigma-54 [Photobacterium damselae]OLQ82082.1 RNA polymerase factor sigma-54 [Photobacterium damselae subsp. piscicida]